MNAWRAEEAIMTCPSRQPGPEHEARSRALLKAKKGCKQWGSGARWLLPGGSVPGGGQAPVKGRIWGPVHCISQRSKVYAAHVSVTARMSHFLKLF